LRTELIRRGMKDRVRRVGAVGAAIALLSGLLFVFATAPTVASATTTSGSYIPLSVPTRICDTRASTASGITDQCTGNTLGAASTLTVQVTGEGGVSSTGVSAVVANVTVTDTTSAGFLTIWPTGQSQPVASSLNWPAGGTVGNLVTVPVSASGQISVYNYAGAADVIVDVDGYVSSAASGTAGLSEPLPPARICDTRSAAVSGITDQCTGNALGAASTLTVQVTGEGGVPSTGVSAVVANVTVTDTTSAGFLTIWPSVQSQPLASSLNWQAGATVANLVVIPVGSSGQISLYNYSGDTDVIVDVEGWFTDGSNPDAVGGSVTPLPPSRVCDTRASSISGLADQCTGKTLGPASTLTVQATGEGGVPSGGVSAVVAHVTVTDTTSAGYLTVWPSGQSQPLASSLNWVAGATVGNLVTIPVSSSGQISIYNSSGATDVIVDVVGYIAPEGALTWSAPTALGVSQNNGSVSCVSATFCMATISPGRNSDGATSTWNGTSWSAPQAIYADPTFWQGADGPMSISCVLTTFCVLAVATDTFMWNGSTWSANVVDSGSNYFIALSCGSTTLCAAVDFAGNAVTWNGSTWSAPLGVDGGHPDSVSCIAASFCVVVDQAGNALTFDGSSWSASDSIDPGNDIDSVSCLSATFCMAADYQGNALIWGGSSWSAPQFIDPGTTYHKYDDDPDSISCVTATYCVGVDINQTVTWNGSSWSAPLSAESSGYLAFVSCPTTTFCGAVDFEGNALVGES
jgi:hypothetical protein